MYLQWQYVRYRVKGSAPSSFAPSTSLFVDVVDCAELERLVAELGEDGATLMPLGDYDFSRAFARINGLFGVSWQLNLP